MYVNPRQLAAEAAALKSAGKLDQAIKLHRHVVALTPTSATSEHNLASALGSAGRWREAETHIERSFAKGGDAPETWLLRARCMQSLTRLDEAEQAFAEVLRRQPLYYDAQQELAQLRWMRTGDLRTSLVDLDLTIHAAPANARLYVIKARVLQFAGHLDAALAFLSTILPAHLDDIALLSAASQIASETGDADTAVALAERAMTLAPTEPVLAVTLISARLAAGQADLASDLADQLRRQAPNDQHAIALQATAWRLLGDARYRELYDYDAFVSAAYLDTPSGWSDLSAYLADLANALTATHAFTTHPFHQSVRHGSQSPDILHRDHPAIAALPQALDGPIQRYIASLGAGIGADPLRARNLGGYAHQGMWSIRMSAGGFHVNHVHPQGWLSSACYVEVPRAMHGKEGWLKFGEPGIRTKPMLEAEHFVEPAPGKLVLFPSYMWHGTVPFTGPSARMTVAFDLAPAASMR